MKKSKKIISLLLSVLMIITSIPLMAVNSFAEDDYIKTSGDFKYVVQKDGTAAIGCYTGSDETVVFPSEIDGYKVTWICYINGIYGDHVPSATKAVIISDGIEFIGNNFFAGCRNLSSVTIPDSVNKIGMRAFDGCSSLTSIVIPDSVEEIGFSAFEGCTALENVTMSNNLTGSVGSDLFRDTAFYNNENNWENGVLYAGSSLIKVKESYAGALEIKDGTKSIASQACYLCGSIEEVIIPDSLVTIGGWAFYSCSFNKITMGNSVKNIGYGAFEGCSKLKNISLPDGIENISERAFSSTGLKEVAIPSSVVNIGEKAFGYGSFSNRVDGFTVYGVNGSAAQRYAQENGFNFYCNWFPDVYQNEWYYNAIKFNVDNNYFHGYGNGYFGPANNIQRQDFVVVLSKIAGVDLSDYADQNGGFSDVPTNDYYSAAVAWAKDNHILSGYANGKFGVGDPITREQACVIFFNYITGYCDMGVGSSNTPEEICSRYPDGGNVSDWARTAVAWAAENHVVGGNGKLNPAGNANRAEMAQIIMNMSNNDIL